ncbi:MAG: hypothetical protein HQL63_10675 [Magnetococcales bacterium]|nr:hypothetical protein [Magnetococcales bacterium]MBF0321615.1 hypothetical protein [Magnetococcales bacterium]
MFNLVWPWFLRHKKIVVLGVICFICWCSGLFFFKAIPLRVALANLQDSISELSKDNNRFSNKKAENNNDKSNNFINIIQKSENKYKLSVHFLKPDIKTSNLFHMEFISNYDDLLKFLADLEEGSVVVSGIDIRSYADKAHPETQKHLVSLDLIWQESENKADKGGLEQVRSAIDTKDLRNPFSKPIQKTDSPYGQLVDLTDRLELGAVNYPKGNNKAKSVLLGRMECREQQTCIGYTLIAIHPEHIILKKMEQDSQVEQYYIVRLRKQTSKK